MLKKLDSTIIIALSTSAALMAFAFYKRYVSSGNYSPDLFYIGAAMICLLPVFYALIRREVCRKL